MDGVYFLFLFLAIFIGYLFGAKILTWAKIAAFLRSKIWLKPSSYPTNLYLRGLNQLLSERQDQAIDTFLHVLTVSNETVETHFALGTVLRRRGQLERAIRIHQNIVDSAGIDERYKPQASLELALDYDASGLLDRAEVLLSKIIESDDGSIRTQALRYLVQIFEKEGEWQKALEATDELCRGMAAKRVSHWRYLQAHYCCELACGAISLQEKAKFLESANVYLKGHPRASLMEAQMYLEQGEYGEALKNLQSLLCSKRYLQVGVPIMLRCYKAQHTDELAGQQLVELFHQHGEEALIPLISKHIQNQGGRESMVNFVVGALEKNVHWPYFSKLLGLSDPASVDCAELQNILEESLPFTFHCEHCGFEGAHWYWCCPACQNWM